MLNQKVFIIASAVTAVLAAPSYRSDLYNYRPLVSFPCGEDVDRWVGSIGIGTPAKQFDLLIDTTTSDSWVAGVKCHSDFCENLSGELYNAGESSTSVFKNKNISLEYALKDGSSATVDASLYTDVFTYPGATYKNVPFGKAFDVEGFEDEHGFAGYLGLAPVEYNSKKRDYGGGDPVGLIALAAGGKQRRNNLQCVLGIGIDQSALVSDVAWLKVPECDVIGKKSWKTDLSCVEIKGAIDIKLQDAIASFDTSTNGIQIPKKQLDEIYKGLNATYNDGEYEFKCCYAGDLKFTLDTYNVVLPVSTWTKPKGSDGEYCTARFEATPDAYGDKQWNLGQTFFRSFFSIYDPVEQRTGLALTQSSPQGTKISPN